MSEQALLESQIPGGDPSTNTVIPEPDKIPGIVQFLRAGILSEWAQWIVFLFLTTALPVTSYFLSGHPHRYDHIVQVAFTASSGMAFYTLNKETRSRFVLLSQPLSFQRVVKMRLFSVYLFLLSFGSIDLWYRYPNESYSGMTLWVSRLLAIVEVLCLVYQEALLLTYSLLFSLTCTLHYLHLKDFLNQFDQLLDIDKGEYYQNHNPWQSDGLPKSITHELRKVLNLCHEMSNLSRALAVEFDALGDENMNFVCYGKQG